MPQFVPSKPAPCRKFADHWQYAMRIASAAGITLKRHNGGEHIQVIGPDCSIINVYTENGRLWWDRNRPRPPFLKLPDQYTLIDIVRATAEAFAKRKQTT